MSEIKDKARAFIVENFLYGNDGNLKDETSFLEGGILDSTGVLELVSFLEETFSIHVEGDDLVPENLDSLNNIQAYVEKRISKGL
jgi:acyl carrier protein